MKRKAKLDEILIWYKFRPSLDIWFSKSEGKTVTYLLPDETWYDGYPFYTGRFVYIQCKLFAIHIKLTWWKIKLR